MKYEINIDRAWPGRVSEEALDEIHVAMASTDGFIDPVCSSKPNQVGATLLVRADSLEEALSRVAETFDAAVASARARTAA